MLILERNPGESIVIKAPGLKAPGQGDTVIVVEAVNGPARRITMTVDGRRIEVYLSARYRWRDLVIMVTAVTNRGCHIGIEAHKSVAIWRGELLGPGHVVPSTRRR